jgi:dimethylargininase
LFKRAIVRPPGHNFAEGLTTFRGTPPDLKKAIDQHQAYCTALEHCGLEVVHLEPDLAHPDSTFIEDVAILTQDFAVLTRPGAESRVGEVELVRELLGSFFQTIHEITAPGALDGGDVCQAGKHFFVGVSQRTNEEGARQLAAFLAQAGNTSSLLDIRALKNVLHLKTGVACIDEGQLVVSEELAGCKEFRDYELIRVAPAESYAANCVRVNDHVLISEGFPNLATAMIQRGFALLQLDMSEFRKMDGGLSCLSLRF